MAWYWSVLVLLATLVAMEIQSWLMHRYLLHGPLWFLHKSHHGPRKGFWEANDVVGFFYVPPSVWLIYSGISTGAWYTWVGFGIMIYGILYFLLHDVLIHRRLPLRIQHNWAYLNRLVRAHKIHHKHLGRLPGEAYGFLYAGRQYAVKKRNIRE